MGILGRKKKRGSDSDIEALDQNEEVSISYDNIDLESIDSENGKMDGFADFMEEKRDKKQASGNKDTVQDICEQIADAKKNMEEAKLEYKAVTDYLADIQKIDRIPSEEREIIEDAARNIITLTRERSKYQSADVKLTDVQFRNISRYEPDMLRELKQMRENEEYQRKVRGDLRQLAAEKAKLEYEKEEIIRSQGILKQLAILSGCLIVLMDIIFLFLTSNKQIDLKTPFILSILLGAGIAFYIFYEARKNRVEIAVNGKKRNKLIGLTNKVKIKYVNTQNALDYAYAKFMVSNSMELSNIYDKYIKAKREAEKYRENTGMLNHYNLILVKELEQYNLKDSDIWIYQAAAFIDSREMVEIRHRLNERRQKLRTRIEFNYGVQENGRNQLKQVIEKKPERKEEIIERLGKYGIEIE